MATTAGKVSINKTSIEKLFIKDVYNQIKSINNKIECEETIDGQFDNVEVDIPTFNFVISPEIVLQMKRGAEKSTSTNKYVFTVIINGDTIATADVIFASAVAAIDAEVERKMFIGYLGSDNNVFIWIGQKNVITIASSNVAICSILGDDKYRYGTGNSGPNLEGCIYYRARSSENDVSLEYTLGNLFNYESAPGFIEYITHISFINAGQEQFRSEYLVNCSEVSQGRSLAIDPGIYFAVGPHSLIKLG